MIKLVRQVVHKSSMMRIQQFLGIPQKYALRVVFIFSIEGKIECF